MLGKLNIMFEDLMKRNNRRLFLNEHLYPKYNKMNTSDASEDIRDIYSKIQNKSEKTSTNSFVSDSNNKFSISNLLKHNKKKFDKSEKGNLNNNTKSRFSVIFFLKIAASLFLLIAAGYSVFFIADNNKSTIKKHSMQMIDTTNQENKNYTEENPKITNDTIVLERTLYLPDEIIIMPETFGFTTSKIDTVKIDLDYIHNFLKNKKPDTKFILDENSLSSESIVNDNMQYYFKIIESLQGYTISIISINMNDAEKLDKLLMEFSDNFDTIGR